MGVDKVGVDEMGRRRSGTKPIVIEFLFSNFNTGRCLAQTGPYRTTEDGLS